MNKFNNFVKKTFFFLIRNITSSIQKTNNKRIILVQESFSGSNTFSMYKLLSDKFKSEKEVILYKDKESKNLIDYIKKIYFLASAKIIITTHASYKLKKSQIHFQMWHAMMIKKGGTMLLNSDQKFSVPKDWKRADYILSYSETYTTFLNSMMTTDPRKYKILGAPRNDFLFKKDDYQKLNKLINIESFRNKIIVCPTMRFETNNFENDNSNNLSLYDFFINKKNSNYFNSETTLVVIKPHPHDEDIIDLRYRDLPKNVFLLTDKKLKSLDIDFYETLLAFDLLITDYSSVYFDFLLLDRPMIFYDPIKDNLKDERGLIIESAKDFFPGEVAQTSDSLKYHIDKNFNEKNEVSNQEKRKKMLNIIHRYKDGESTKRIEKFINELV